MIELAPWKVVQTHPVGRARAPCACLRSAARSTIILVAPRVVRELWIY